MHTDTLIIGAGQAASPLARRLAESGERVVLVERAQLGGTCVNVGCTPTKTIIASARAAHVVRRGSRLGVRTGPVRVDLPAVVDRKDAIVRRWREGVQKTLDHPAITVIAGEARFGGPGKVLVKDRVFTAGRIIINAGCRPRVPDLAGLGDVPWLDNESLLQLRDLPEHLVVLGGGYIGCELGQAFARFGSRVTICDHNAHLLSREDEDLSTALEQALVSEGLALELGSRVTGIEKKEAGVTVRLENKSVVSGSHLLVATGRRPNTDCLRCEAGGIDLDSRGFIRTNDGYRTSAEGVYAVGDITGGPQFTHSSWDDHRILFDLLRQRASRSKADRLVPYAVFTDPQLARVGLSEREAAAKGVDCEVASMPFGDISRAIEVDETEGVLKVLLDPASGKVLGAGIVGIEAGELIHVFVALIRAGAPAQALVNAEMIHPTLAEGLQSVVMRLERFSRT